MGSLGGISNTSANTLCLNIFLPNLMLLTFETHANDSRFLEFVAWHMGPEDASCDGVLGWDF